jgi:hexosaminidase
VKIVVPTPPKTTLTADGITGSGTFNNLNVTITFSVTDGSAGSGVKQTNYRVDSGGWNTVTGSVYLTEEGVHTIDYFSEDNLGDQEDVQHLIIGIDKTAPTLAVTVNGTPLSDGTEFQDSQSITLALQAADNLSGVAEQSITVDGMPYVPGTALEWAGKLGTHVIQIVVTDKAGNVSQSVINVNVKTSISAMKELVERYFASGDLKGSLKNELLEKLKDAQEHFSKGNVKETIDDMKDILEKIDKPNKKDQISDRAKTALVADANALIQSWSGNASHPDHDHESGRQDDIVHDLRKGEDDSR